MLTIKTEDLKMLAIGVIVGNILYYAMTDGDWIKAAAVISAQLLTLIAVRLCATKS